MIALKQLIIESQFGGLPPLKAGYEIVIIGLFPVFLQYKVTCRYVSM
jgi:hypothetical protein